MVIKFYILIWIKIINPALKQTLSDYLFLKMLLMVPNKNVAIGY